MKKLCRRCIRIPGLVSCFWPYYTGADKPLPTWANLINKEVIGKTLWAARVVLVLQQRSLLLIWCFLKIIHVYSSPWKTQAINYERVPFISVLQPPSSLPTVIQCFLGCSPLEIVCVWSRSYLFHFPHFYTSGDTLHTLLCILLFFPLSQIS